MLYDASKRLLDILISIVALIVFSPVIVATAIAIRLNSKGPLLADTPPRIGEGGRSFRMYKFRSMVANAHEILVSDPKYKDLLTEYKKGGYKLKDDPRITTVGRFIRKYSFDEIPQFVNVLKGDMSVVGPRAYYPDELRDQQKKYPFTRDAVKVVLSVKPGITGIWQVTGRSQINFDKRIQLDASYAKRRSILFDFYLLLKTPIAMFSGKGAM